MGVSLPADVSQLEWTCGSVEAGVKILLFLKCPEFLSVFSVYEEDFGGNCTISDSDWC